MKASVCIFTALMCLCIWSAVSAIAKPASSVPSFALNRVMKRVLPDLRMRVYPNPHGPFFAALAYRDFLAKRAHKGVINIALNQKGIVQATAIRVNEGMIELMEDLGNVDAKATKLATASSSAALHSAMAPHALIAPEKQIAMMPMVPVHPPEKEADVREVDIPEVGVPEADVPETEDVQEIAENISLMEGGNTEVEMVYLTTRHDMNEISRAKNIAAVASDGEMDSDFASSVMRLLESMGVYVDTGVDSFGSRKNTEGIVAESGSRVEAREQSGGFEDDQSQGERMGMFVLMLPQGVMSSGMHVGISYDLSLDSSKEASLSLVFPHEHSSRMSSFSKIMRASKNAMQE